MRCEQPSIPDHPFRFAGDDAGEVGMRRVDENVPFPACHNRGNDEHCCSPLPNPGVAKPVQRQALYVQDGWTLAAATALQLGLRLERLETVSEGNVFGGVRQTRQLVGPVLRMSSEPAAGLGTFKRGLSRGFKLPTRRDAGVTWQPRPRLTWRLSVAPVNGATACPRRRACEVRARDRSRHAGALPVPRGLAPVPRLAAGAGQRARRACLQSSRVTSRWMPVTRTARR